MESQAAPGGVAIAPWQRLGVGAAPADPLGNRGPRTIKHLHAFGINTHFRIGICQETLNLEVDWIVSKSKKKGLSFEEKRARMMEIFFETKDVFQLKDIEKIAPKEKGITSMSVKEILQSLVDDGMVDTDRIGTSNYFWAFPSKALHARKRKLEELESQFAESSQKKEALQKSIEKSKIGREDTAERAALMEELAALRQKKEQLKAEIDKYRECDPDVVEEMRQTNKVAKEAANRWTDNIFSIKSWAKRKFGFEESRIDKGFGIPEDLDYID
ncbi:meiotic nuclear division protein 1 homolog isoform X2 [Corapipo altera]|nr:meiotic nuclear division protein 1 homolog isoform X2 [Corapipo altera]